MAFETFYSVKDLTQRVGQIEDQFDIVSFDLFDTLLVRRIHEPDLVKLAVAQYISMVAAAHDIDMDRYQVQTLRDKIEREMRAKTGEQYDDHEAHYPTLMRELVRQIFVVDEGDQLLNRVTDYELQMENAMLVPREGVVDCLKRLAESGKRLFIISDMYLPAEHLKRLVAHAGLLSYVEAVISSADTFLAKASGHGYQHVAKTYDLDFKRWLHIGDNEISDGLRADEKGIAALVIRDPEEQRRRAVMSRCYRYGLSHLFWRGRAMQQLMAPLEAEDIPRSELYTEGYHFLGPLLSYYIHQLADQCRKSHITKVFFLAREGWLLKQLWDEIVPGLYPDGAVPEVGYLYVSRMALAGSSLAYRGLTEEDASVVFLPQSNRDFRDVCRVFDLDIEPLRPYLKQYHLGEDETLSHCHAGYDIKNWVKFCEMLNDEAFQSQVKSQALPKNQALQLYLQDQGFFLHDQVALSDIGWLGTIQRFLYQSIAHRNDKPALFGKLFAASRGVDYPESEGNKIEGLVYDGARFDLRASTILYAQDIFEEACRAPHPTLMRYKLVGGQQAEQTYELEFRRMVDASGEAELAQDAHYQEVQQGILAAASRYSAAAAIVSPDPQDLQHWMGYLLVNKLAFPRSQDIKTLRLVHHLDDFQGKHKPKKGRAALRWVRNPWGSSGLFYWLSLMTKKRFYKKHVKNIVDSF